MRVFSEMIHSYFTSHVTIVSMLQFDLDALS